MRNKKLDQLIVQMENYLECWKQFNHYVAMARAKKFEPEDEAQFLEVKSVIAQELELIRAAVDLPSPTKEEIHKLLSEVPSIRYLSEAQEGGLRGVENQWHKIFIAWQANLGQLKVKQREMEGQSRFGSMFNRKKE